ncbi:MAG: glycosyltransferase family 1 protein [Magnetospirillum sp.]|nr:MAG: glycosyltransferase family 1 protein [Magnetospirillum sp.]
MAKKGSILLVSMPPYRGGVPALVAIMGRHLISLGWEVRLAFYATLGDNPDLVAPSWRLLSGAVPKMREEAPWNGMPTVAVGCRFPELEATYTQSSAFWRKLVASHDRHIAIGGNPLVSNILVECGVRHLLLCAASVEEDRCARAEAMPFLRRLVDTLAVRPLLEAQQKRALASPLAIRMGISRYTCRLIEAEGATPLRLLPIPTDGARFTPPAVAAAPGVIGFAARLGDPRKRVPMLIEAVALLAQDGHSVRLRLAGEAPAFLPALAERLGIAGLVEFLGHVPDEHLPAFYQSLDVFALPSSQEGLGIVGIEAMASGVPVVSAARNCGPDDFVVEGVTGAFAGDSPRELADRLAAIIGDRPLRAAMSAAARQHAVLRFGEEAFAAGLAEAWRDAWGDAP